MVCAFNSHRSCTMLKFMLISVREKPGGNDRMTLVDIKELDAWDVQLIWWNSKGFIL